MGKKKGGSAGRKAPTGGGSGGNRKKTNSGKNGNIRLEDATDTDVNMKKNGPMSWMNPLDEADAAEESSLRSRLDRRGSGRANGGSDSRALWEISGSEDSDDDFNTKDVDRRAKLLRKGKIQPEEDDMASDIEEERNIVYEDDVVGGDAWGSRKKYFYGGNPNEINYNKKKKGGEKSDSDSELDEAEMEAKESQKLQLKQLEQMDEGDFLDAFGPIGGEEEEEEEEDEEDVTESAKKAKKKKTKKEAKKKSGTDKEEVKLDLSSLSKKERVRLFNQESPEFSGIMADLDLRLKEAARLSRFIDFIEEGVLPKGPATDFILTKYQVMLNYCANISCYLMFKASRASLKVHPLTGRLVQYKTLLDEMAPLDAVIGPQLDAVEERLREKGVEGSAEDAEREVRRLVKREARKHMDRDAKAQKGKSAKRLRILDPSGSEKEKDESEPKEDLTADERIALELYGALRKDKQPLADSSDSEASDAASDTEAAPALPEGEDDEEEGDGRRAITRQIQKNKGLTPKRSKLQRNPRVKNRVKFQKAKVRRKGQVREVRSETAKYGGEFSGINARVKKGVKLG